MEADRVAQISVCDSQHTRLRFIGGPLSWWADEVLEGLSVGEVTLNASDPAVEDLLAPGAHVLIEYGIDGPNYQLIYGPVVGWQQDVLGTGKFTFQISDDRLLNEPARVVPGSLLSAASLTDPAQSWQIGPTPAAGVDENRSGYYSWSALPALDFKAARVVKALIDLNVNDPFQSRFGVPKVEFFGWGSPTLEYGGDVTGVLPQVRFGLLREYVFPLLRAGGICLKLERSNAGAFRDGFLSGRFWEPIIHSTPLSPDAGTVTGGQLSWKYPTATDVIVGGPGEASARHFAGYADVARSQRFRDIQTAFRENTGAPTDWPSTVDEQLRVAKYFVLRPEVSAAAKSEFQTSMTNAAADVLDAGGEVTGMSVTLAESQGFRFTGEINGSGFERGFAVGDTVTVQPAASARIPPVSGQITKVHVVFDAKGYSAVPTVGLPTESPDAELAKTVRSIVTAVNRRSTRQ